MTDDSERKSRAVSVFLGRGLHGWPGEYPERLVEEFGEDQGLDLLLYVQTLLDELWAVPLDWTNEPDLWKRTDRIVATVAANHPELSAEALDTLRWHYSYQSK